MENIVIESVIGENDLWYPLEEIGLLLQLQDIKVPDNLEGKKFYPADVNLDAREEPWTAEIDIYIEPEKRGAVGLLIAKKIVLIAPWGKEFSDLVGRNISLTINPAPKTESEAFADFKNKMRESGEKQRRKIRNPEDQT